MDDCSNSEAMKWARVSNPMPRRTIGVPKSEQINSPVTFGDQVIDAEMKGEKMDIMNDIIFSYCLFKSRRFQS